MASGHVNRPSRPNTWLHRPSCKREENPCQRGAVHTWHFSEVPPAASEGRSWLHSGHQQTARGRAFMSSRPRSRLVVAARLGAIVHSLGE